MSGTVYPTATAAVRDLIVATITPSVTALGGTIFRARAWPLQMPALPAVLVYGWEDEGRAISVSSENSRYDVVCQMVVQAVVSAPTPQAVEISLEAFKGAINDAVLTSPALLGDGGKIERVASFKSKIEVPRQTNEDAMGELTLTFALEWSELYSVVYPTDCGGACVAPNTLTIQFAGLGQGPGET